MIKLIIKLLTYLTTITISITLYKSNMDFKLLFDEHYHLTMYYLSNNTYYVSFIAFFIIFLHFVIKKEDKQQNNENNLNSQMRKKAKELPINFDFYNTNDDSKLNIQTMKNEDIKNKMFDILESENNGLLIYKNKSGKIDFDKYLNNKDNIKQYFNIDKETDIKILRYEHNKIKIDLVDRFPKDYNFSNERHLKEEHIFFGTNENNKDIFININKLTHYFINGASGSGKTIFIYQLLMGMFFNLKYINKIYLVDLKGGISFNKFKNIDKEKIVVVKDLNETYNAVNEIYNINEERMAEIIQRQENGEEIDKIETDPIIFLIDEFAQIQDRQPMKEDKENFERHKKMLKQLDSLAATARSQNIKMFIITQKGTIKESGVTFKGNLQSQILLKVKSSEAITGCLGSSDSLEELGVNPKVFGYGRNIFQDDSNPSGLKVHYNQGVFVPNDTYKKLPNIKNNNEKSKNYNLINGIDTSTEEYQNIWNDYINTVNILIEKMNERKNEFNEKDYLFMNKLQLILNDRNYKIIETQEFEFEEKLLLIIEKLKEEKKIDIDLDKERKRLYNYLMKNIEKSKERVQYTNELLKYKNNIENNEEKLKELFKKIEMFIQH